RADPLERWGSCPRPRSAVASHDGCPLRPALPAPFSVRISLSSSLLPKATMSQKSSLLQLTPSVSRSLTANNVAFEWTLRAPVRVGAYKSALGGQSRLSVNPDS